MQFSRCFILAAACAAASVSSAATVAPADDGRALDNPGMGWTFQYYSNVPFRYGSTVPPGDSLAWFPGCNVCYLRIPWSYIEPEEGVYNWAALDTPAQRWIARGGKVAFRITCCESWLEYATPKWVFDAGAKGVRFNHGWGPDGGPDPNGKCIAPDYGDRVFLKKLAKFLKVMAARYDGRDEVAFVDLGSFGCWGEGHTASSSRLAPDVQERQVRLHLAMLRRAFRETQLVAGRDVCTLPSGQVDGSYTNYVYARSMGISWRDDGIMCQPPPRSFFGPKPAEAYWPTLPVVLEHEHYSSSKARGAWSGTILEDAVEVHHASYLSIHGDPNLIYGENSNAVLRINRRLGYRFNPVRISWPDEVTVGEKGEAFEVSWTWANVGVAPCYRDVYPALTVKNARGEIMAVLADADFSLKTLSVGEPGKAPTKRHAMRHTLGRWQAPTFVAGDYDVYVSVGECDGTPVVELPLAESDGQRRYRVGRMRFVKGR